jgi:hypothetical protein
VESEVFNKHKEQVMTLKTGQVIYSCGHVQTAVFDTNDWQGKFDSRYQYPTVRDDVPCQSCREGKTPEWDRNEHSRTCERSQRAAAARKLAASLELPQRVVDRAASYASDLYGRSHTDAESAVRDAVNADRSDPGFLADVKLNGSAAAKALLEKLGF